ncbi:MAG: cob(I)yrinic acid a,c-diamide adenosyltransferase [Spirochaetes bacterium]|nr:cob(I)yrinic acid a,c-diamide adenosyltransferase [Spirochaetota bacterium]
MIHIFYGNGKGKTTAAVGMLIRASGRNLRSALVKFFKPEDISGEDIILKELKNVILYHSRYSHPGAVKDKKEHNLYKERSFQDQKRLFGIAQKLAKKDLDLLILDEVLDLIVEKVILPEDLIRLLRTKKESVDLVLTGHTINKELLEAGDMVTEMKKIRHYYDKKIGPRKGIEW